MILTRFSLDSGWPAHKRLPIFKKCFNNLVSLKTGSKVIALLWMLLFATLGFVELRTALTERALEEQQLQCLFNQSYVRGGLCHPSQPESGGVDGIFLYGNYRCVPLL